MQPRANRFALVLFAVYLVLYSGFVFLNAYAPATMEATPIAGVNLAILYGFGLIAAAFLLALLYGWLVVEPQEAGPSDHPKDEAASRDRTTATAPNRTAPSDRP